MSALATLGGMLLALVLGLASVPWLFWSMGRAMLGDYDGSDAAMHKSPLWRYFEWIEARAD